MLNIKRNEVVLVDRWCVLYKINMNLCWRDMNNKTLIWDSGGKKDEL